jgi:hypothetical protein
MLLGDLLARFEDEAVATESILRLGDLSLVAKLNERADANGQTLGDYAVCAVRRFSTDASDEQWVTLIGALARAEDPGTVCLRYVLAYSLEEMPAG